ncbi:MAG: 4-hydroxy-tetrahydrodipicolinate synthase [Rickettsiales bacterium]
MRFHGAATALVTPFANGRIDVTAYEALIETQIEAGISGLVPAGTTGECPVLSHDEHNEIVRVCVRVAQGRATVIAGTGSNATDEAISLTKAAEKAGADAALIVAPYYNKPCSRGLYAHFKAIHDATTIPIILYNVPGRTVVDISVELALRLGELERIVGIKDATGDLSRPARIKNGLGADFIQLSGEDATAVAFNAQGGCGVISVTSNVAPAQVAAIQKACFDGDFAKAAALDAALVDLHASMFCAPSPAPAKYAASLLGLCDEEVRLPLVAPSEEKRERIVSAMRGAGLEFGHV